MSAWADGYVQDIEYSSHYYREISPTHLNFAALGQGIRPPSTGEGSAYCELGCGQGLGSIIVAATASDPAPLQYLAHGSVVVTGLDVADIEAAVIRFFHAISVVDHAGGNGGFALGVADVETFDALYRVWKRQGCLQGRQSLFLLSGSLVFREYRQPGILQGHVRPGLVQD